MNEKDEYNFEQARQGPVIESPPTKTRITIRIDTDIIEWFRNKVHEAGGGNYQTLINAALRDYIHQQDSRLAETIRQVIREELQALSK